MLWDDGYNSEVEYTHTYCSDLNPLKIKYALTINGIFCKEITTACELGFGQGLTLNFNAIDKSINWYGCDFIPEHVTNARQISEEVGTELRLSDTSFDQLNTEYSGIKFDFICLHGVWSWISEKNRGKILDFIGNNLAIGGILYVSYNCKPGWSSMMPYRDLMLNYANSNMPSGETSIARTKGAIDFGKRLSDTNPLYLKQNPVAQKKVSDLSIGDLNYISHEYFNKDWESFNFSEVNKVMENRKLGYASSTDLFAHLDEIHLEKVQRGFLSELIGLNLQQDVKDLYLSQSFRKDIWVKGAINLTVQEKVDALSKIFICENNPLDTCDYEIRGNLGSGSLDKEVYEPIIQNISQNSICSIGSVISAVSDRVEMSKVIEAIHVLVAKGDIVLAHDPDTSQLNLNYSLKINRVLSERLKRGIKNNFLFSPVTGGGVELSHLNQIFIGIINQNKLKRDNEICFEAFSILKVLGRGVLKDGVIVKDDAEAIEVLGQKLTIFKDTQLQRLVNLRILVDPAN